MAKNKNIAKKLSEKFSNENVLIKHFQNLGGIWVRDWGPFQFINSNSSSKFYKADYCYDYYHENEKKYGEMDNEAGSELCELLLELNSNSRVEKLDLKWDGGNLTHNGKGTAIITEKLLIDNDKYSKEEIETLLKNKFGFEKIIFIPVEPYDVLGHTDGIVRFISKNKLLLAEYPIKYKLGYEYLNQLEIQLRTDLGDTYEIIKIKNELPKNKKSEGVYSAWGSYINYLKVNDTIFLPWYENAYYKEENYSILKNALPECKIIKVDSVDLLSNKGGVLNCISQTYV